MDELPVVGKAAVVAIAELVEDDAPGIADACGQFQHFDELLRGQATGQRFPCGGKDGESGERVTGAEGGNRCGDADAAGESCWRGGVREEGRQQLRQPQSRSTPGNDVGQDSHDLGRGRRRLPGL
jgi:hypothetical protein